MPLLAGAEPFYSEGNDIGILMSHGFTGSPRSIKPWAQALAGEGFTVSVPRLPGHGTTWQEMNKTRWQDWYAELDREYLHLREQCQQVFVMGLSMGGSLTLRLAENHPEVAGMVIVNAAVHTERPDRFLLPYLRHFVPGFPGITNDIKKPGVDEGGYDKIPLQAAYSLQQLWAKVKQDIDNIRQPLLVMRSTEDHVVEPSNTTWILDHVQSEDLTYIELHNSYHVATIDYDGPLIARESAAFVRRIASQQLV